MQFIEKELKINPKATAKELQQKAKAVSEAVGKLSVRQFHAKYPLQIRRKLAPKKPRRAAPKAKAAPKKPRRAAPKKPRRAAPKARAAPKKPRSAAPKATAARGQVNREAIRDTLMTFAKDLSDAEGKSETIAVLRKLDTYIDAIIRAAT
jgi:predicted lipid-binding transport protein (Tim44 family)